MRLCKILSAAFAVGLVLAPNLPGRLILVPIAPAHWAGFDFEENWWADTGNLLGWIRPETKIIHYNFIYVRDLETHIFLPVSLVEEDGSGAWAYVFDGVERPANPNAETAWGGFERGEDGFYNTGHFLGEIAPIGDFVYVANLNGFAHLPERHLDGVGAWVYFYTLHL